MKIVFIYLFLLTLLASPISWGADFAKGWIAYKTGDYATSLEEWTPLAEQGTALAQPGGHGGCPERCFPRGGTVIVAASRRVV